jgi:3-deoxy-7-phosphoheptulonate synthase
MQNNDIDNIDGINDINIIEQRVLVSPAQLKRELPESTQTKQTVKNGRLALQKILDREDARLMVVTGPCSIHDIKAAKEYAQRLKQLSNELSDTLLIIMRVYFEKPRTTIGWKGLINDPHLNDSFDIEKGLRQARELLIWLAELGLPAGTEALDPIVPQYLDDLFCWAAIGARTTESQTHRELASGLSMPVGFKNGTDGSLDIAINAMQSAASSHHFLGINQDGQVTVIKTRGNRYGHVILRGGKQTNYDSMHVKLCEDALSKANLPVNIVIDCSHGNSSKKPELQPLVAHDVAHQILEGNQSIVGIMLESHLHEGNQPIKTDISQLKYGVSVTDACIDWKTTESLLRDLHQKLRSELPKRIR